METYFWRNTRSSLFFLCPSAFLHLAVQEVNNWRTSEGQVKHSDEWAGEETRSSFVAQIRSTNLKYLAVEPENTL